MALARNDNMNELHGDEWRSVVGYEGLYAVARDGRVKSARTGKLMAHVRIPPLGRAYVGLTLNKKQKLLILSRLVLWAFAGPPSPGQEACHNDGDAGNNSLQNLRWDTRRGNFLDRLEHGTWPSGVNNSMARLNEKQVRVIRFARSMGASYAGMSRLFGVAPETVSQAARGITWASPSGAPHPDHGQLVSSKVEVRDAEAH